MSPGSQDPDDLMATDDPRHMICGKCKLPHSYVAQVRHCYGLPDLTVWPCSWLMEGRDEDGVTYYDCGARTRFRADGTGYDCDLGHEHTYAEAREAQGWDYAEDAEEAKRLARVGVAAREMDGHVWVA